MVFSNLNPNFKVSAFFEVECHCLGSDFGLVLCQMWDQVFDLEIDYLVHLCAPREGGLWRGENFCLRLATAIAQCLRLSERFFHLCYVVTITFDLCLTSDCPVIISGSARSGPP